MLLASLAAFVPVHHYHAHNRGCRTRACDARVWRWWGIHHPKHRKALEAATGPSESALASWYDDAEGTACGTHYSIGVANKILACGTRVQLCYRGCEIAVVEDRGPFVAGREFDLNAGAKARISCSDLCSLRYRVMR